MTAVFTSKLFNDNDDDKQDEDDLSDGKCPWDGLSKTS
jgi:hypothetical protein